MFNFHICVGFYIPYKGYGNDSFFLEPLNKPSSNENNKKVSERLSRLTTEFLTVWFFQCLWFNCSITITFKWKIHLMNKYSLILIHLITS